MSSKFTKGTLLWVKHPTEAWQPATVNEVLPKGKLNIFFANGDNASIRTQANYPLLRTIRCEGDIELSGAGDAAQDEEEDLFNDDLTKMTQLITPAVLHSLRRSYRQGRFYSKLGSGTILALNPFKEVPDLFTLKTIQSYHSVSLSELQSLPAHVYAAAQNALVTLRASVGRVNQSIIVSGESGAGKTWTVRCLMRYLAEVGIEFKRRLSSTDLSTSPLKGFHSSPIRSELKHDMCEHGHGRVHRHFKSDPDNVNGFENQLAIHDLDDSLDGGQEVKVHAFPGNKIHLATQEENINFNNNHEILYPEQFYENKISHGLPGCHNSMPQSSISALSENFEDFDVTENEPGLDVSIKIVDRIERRILYSNPILEAFGNAHTLRNENSSRFGKYIQLQYDRSGTIVGAQLRTYLLEKTRAVRHDPGERSYHIFYQMLHGATSDEKKEWKMPNCPFPEDPPESPTAFSSNEDSAYTSTCSTSYENQKRYESEFEETRSSMTSIGITNQMQTQVFKLLSAVLHLRLLTFVGADDLQNPCTLDPDDPKSGESLKTAAELLGVEEEVIMQVITFREITAHSKRRKSVFHRPCTEEECRSRRDIFAKLIYEVLFKWIVQRVGDSVCAPPDKWCSFIGLLDVYGFESFENNSLEQLCINYANEKLQQHFVASFLREQQEEYIAEGVEWSHCDLTDNVECLLALEAPRNSLFSLLNEECRLNRSNASSQLKSRVEAMFSQNRYIIQPRISKKAPSFSVVHYAGQVSYTTQDMIEKNKDEVPPEISQLLYSSTVSFINDIASDGRRSPESDISDLSTPGSDVTVQNKGKHRPTVLSRFKKSLDELLETLGSTDCHYIRCIKPNRQSVPDVFDAQFVLSQLEACGVVETIRVCAPAHPNKMPYKEFIARYGFVLRRKEEKTKQEEDKTEKKDRKRRRCVTNHDMQREACERIVRSIEKNKEGGNGSQPFVIESQSKKPLQFGKTMIFLSSELFESLESARSAEIVKSAVTVQKAWRQFVVRRQCRAERKMMITRRNSASSVLQRVWRNKVHMRKCRAERHVLVRLRQESVRRIQKFWMKYKRTKDAREEMKKLSRRRSESAICIQSAFRGWRVRCKYRDLMDAWRQLKLLPDEGHRSMVERRLRGLLPPRNDRNSFPSFGAIKSAFEVPKEGRTSPHMVPQKVTSGGDSGAHEKLTVYYDQLSSKRIVVKENVLQDDLDLEVEDLKRKGQNPKQVLHSSPKRDHDQSSMTSNLTFDPENFVLSPLRSIGMIKHAKLVSSCTNLSSLKREERRRTPERSKSMPRYPIGPGVIYAWHNRPIISMMAPKRPMSLCSDPLTLLEIQYNDTASVLTTPLSNILSSKRHSRGRRAKRRHSDRRNRSFNQSGISNGHASSFDQSAVSFSQITPSGYTWSPGHAKNIARKGSYCILKYADVPPKEID